MGRWRFFQTGLNEVALMFYELESRGVAVSPRMIEGAELVLKTENHSCGPSWISYRYVVRKR